MPWGGRINCFNICNKPEMWSSFLYTYRRLHETSCFFVLPTYVEVIFMKWLLDPIVRRLCQSPMNRFYVFFKKTKDDLIVITTLLIWSLKPYYLAVPNSFIQNSSCSFLRGMLSEGLFRAVTNFLMSSSKWLGWWKCLFRRLWPPFLLLIYGHSFAMLRTFQFHHHRQDRNGYNELHQKPIARSLELLC